MTDSSQPPVVTFDLFSALLDSRTGGSRTFSAWAAERGWPVPGEEVYDRWDAANKAAQKQSRQWVPFRELSLQALRETYAALELKGDVVADCAALLDSVPEWEPWPDVPDGLPSVADRFETGILSNVDDDIVAGTQVAGLVTAQHVYTSERLRAYKPDPRIYQRAAEAVPGLVHVATSARDVRGALEAGLIVVRLKRPGHQVDPDGPQPPYEAADLMEVRTLLEEAPWQR